MPQCGRCSAHAVLMGVVPFQLIWLPILPCDRANTKRAGPGLRKICTAEVSLSKTQSLPAAGLLFCRFDFPAEEGKLTFPCGYPQNIIFCGFHSCATTNATLSRTVLLPLTWFQTLLLVNQSDIKNIKWYVPMQCFLSSAQPVINPTTINWDKNKALYLH